MLKSLKMKKFRCCSQKKELGNPSSVLGHGVRVTTYFVAALDLIPNIIGQARQKLMAEMH